MTQHLDTGNGSVWLRLQVYKIMAPPDRKVQGANMGPTWVLSAPDGPHVGPMNLAIRDKIQCWLKKFQVPFPIGAMFQSVSIEVGRH